MNLLDRYKKVQESIAAHAAKARRDPKAIALIAVTKSASTEQLKQLVEVGHFDFGESRVQQLQRRLSGHFLKDDGKPRAMAARRYTKEQFASPDAKREV